LPPELPPFEQVRHVHLIAVCGTGMGSLACMLADRGFRVTGSDSDAYPPMSDQLTECGISIYKGFSADHITGERPDLVVIGNAVRRDNPEARATLESGLPYLSFPDAVHQLFLRGKHSVVIAGTHGKTTTTSLVGHVLERTGCDPSVLVGGVVNSFGGSFRLGEGEHFVIEGDEYDTAFFDKTPKFLHYDARSLVFTSCEFDHADIYDSLDEIQQAFRSLCERVPSDGRIVAATDSPCVSEVLGGVSAPVEGYGFQEDALWRTSDVAFDASGTQFSVWRGGERLARVRVPMWGRHNVENVLGALALTIGLGVDAEQAAGALEDFGGVRRRQETRGERGGVLVVDDFAHHPTAVHDTVASIRARFPDRKLFAIFEPRTNTTRRRIFEEAYGEAFEDADVAILAGVFRPELIPEEDRMRPERVVDALRGRGTEAVYLPEVDDIIEFVCRNRTGNDVALIMSNGAFGGIQERLLAQLRRAEEI
jgi:UDP-N-acetylmuramate: L-alanyl-gamma-D-glutamyl-meso-diaminopimelate ligase